MPLPWLLQNPEGVIWVWNANVIYFNPEGVSSFLFPSCHPFGIDVKLSFVVRILPSLRDYLTTNFFDSFPIIFTSKGFV